MSPGDRAGLLVHLSQVALSEVWFIACKCTAQVQAGLPWLCISSFERLSRHQGGYLWEALHLRLIPTNLIMPSRTHPSWHRLLTRGEHCCEFAPPKKK